MKKYIVSAFLFASIIGCKQSLPEGIYIGQDLSYIVIGPNNTFTASEVRIDGNAINALTDADSGFIPQLTGQYKLTSDKLIVNVSNNIILQARVNEHSITFGEGLPEQTWHRWYGGQTLSDYKAYFARTILLRRDCMILTLHKLAINAISYKNDKVQLKLENASYLGFDYLDNRKYLYNHDNTVTYTIKQNTGSFISFEATWQLRKYCFVNLTINEIGQITNGPNISGF